jgi:hypothetical protein
LPGHPVGAQRHNGFLKGFGLTAPEKANNTLGKPTEVVCMADSYGDQTKGQTGMETCLQKNPDINVVYTINEPTAAGAYKALKAASKEKGVVLVSVDGGCQESRCRLRDCRHRPTVSVKMAELARARRSSRRAEAERLHGHRRRAQPASRWPAWKQDFAMTALCFGIAVPRLGAVRHS